MARRRHLSRIAVMQVLFERESRPQITTDDALSRNASELGQIDADFARTLLTGILQKEQELRTLIEQHAPSWTWDRMDPISRCALLIGAYELVIAREAPPAVIMDECIEIAKEYGTDESGKFVNGVLNAIAQGMRAG